jgi:hypothetical protein
MLDLVDELEIGGDTGLDVQPELDGERQRTTLFRAYRPICYVDSGTL